jgi:hypothetical protein
LLPLTFSGRNLVTSRAADSLQAAIVQEMVTYLYSWDRCSLYAVLCIQLIRALEVDDIRSNVARSPLSGVNDLHVREHGRVWRYASRLSASFPLTFVSLCPGCLSSSIKHCLTRDCELCLTHGGYAAVSETLTERASRVSACRALRTTTTTRRLRNVTRS